MAEKKERFEKAYEKLREISEKIKDDDTSLEDSIKLYEEGMKYYAECDGILNDAEQKIEVIGGEGREVTE